jgi:rod shape-determining protein MreD
MKRSLVFFAFGILLVLFQASFLSRLFPLAPRPNLVLIVLVYLSTSGGLIWPPLWAAGMGLFFDVLSGGPCGLFIFVFLVLYMIMRGVCRVFLLEHPIFLAGAVLLAHFLQAIILLIVLSFLGLPFPGEPSQAIQFFLSSLIAALLSLPFFVLIERIDFLPALPPLD